MKHISKMQCRYAGYINVNKPYHTFIYQQVMCRSNKYSKDMKIYLCAFALCVYNYLEMPRIGITYLGRG